MGNVDRLLASLAQKLPGTADRAVLAAALRAAAEALPEKHARTRTRLSQTEDACIERLLGQLQPSSADKAAAAEDDEAELAAGVDTLAAGESAGSSLIEPVDLYGDLDSGSPLSCTERCAKLLSEALMGLRPTKRAHDAISGLLALFPPEVNPTDPDVTCTFDLKTLESCARLIALASALLQGSNDQDSALWRRFMGFALGAPLRLAEPGAPGAERAAALAARLGGLAALAARPAAARAALRLALARAGAATGAGALGRLAALLPPAVDAGFRGQAFEGETLTRGDLVGLLQAIRVAKLCRTAGVGCKFALAEVRDLLRATLEQHVGASALWPELQRLAQSIQGPRGKALRRRLEGMGKERASAAAATVELVEAVAASVEPASLAAIASNCGLPIGSDEDFDVRAAAARARGDLFFEDAGGNTLAAGPAEGGADAAAVAAVSGRVLERIEGLEGLRPKRGADAPEELAAEGDDPDGPDDAGPSEAAEASTGARRAKRRRRGKQPS